MPCETAFKCITVESMRNLSLLANKQSWQRLNSLTGASFLQLSGTKKIFKIRTTQYFLIHFFHPYSAWKSSLNLFERVLSPYQSALNVLYHALCASKKPFLGIFRLSKHIKMHLLVRLFFGSAAKRCRGCCSLCQYHKPWNNYKIFETWRKTRKRRSEPSRVIWRCRLQHYDITHVYTF